MQTAEAVFNRCSSLSLPTFHEFDVISISIEERHNYTIPASGTTESVTVDIHFCHLTVTITHGDDIVNNWVWFPWNDWNHRFVVNGGGGLHAGIEANNINTTLAGYVSGSTDGGLTLNGTVDPNSGTWAIKSPGIPNLELVKNYGYRAPHDLAIIGKAAIHAFYGTSQRHSYFIGCSNGGRQGYTSAERYPDDFDGIAANAPALRLPRLYPALFWPVLIMDQITAPPRCVFDAYTRAIISACDHLDGAEDGIVALPDLCHFDSKQLIGSTVDCVQTGSKITITHADSQVVAKILQGARDVNGNWLWYGITPGSTIGLVANTNTTNNTTVAIPFPATESWLRYLVYQDPDYKTRNMSVVQFTRAFHRSVKLLTQYSGSEIPDLTDFEKHGKKMISWHGTSDVSINPDVSLDFRRALEEQVGGSKKANNFHRLFFAPGASHCQAGEVGPMPVNPLDYLTEWVENGKAPATMYAATVATNGTTIIDRNLCPYPQMVTYKGSGDVTSAESFYCQ